MMPGALYEASGIFLWLLVERELVVETLAHFGGHERAGFGGALEEFVADACDAVVSGVADLARNDGAEDCGQAPEAAETVEDVEDGGGAGEELTVGGGDDDTVGDGLAVGAGFLEDGCECFAFKWGEAKDIVGAGIFGQDQTDPALAEAATSIIKDLFNMCGFFAGNPGRVEGEKMNEEHADCEVGEGDGCEDSDVQSDEAEPEPGAQAADECEWEGEEFDGECGVGEGL